MIRLKAVFTSAFSTNQHY